MPSAAVAALLDGLAALSQNLAPGLLDKICQVLQTASPTTSVGDLLARLPATPNSDACFQLRTLLQAAPGLMTWPELGWCLRTAAHLQEQQQREGQIELVCTGPQRDGVPPLRRLDQVLYDLIHQARRDILLVTFAAARIARLKTALGAAAARAVTIRLVLEFEQESGGQLSHDALAAFAGSIEHQAEIYYWPLAHREKNAYGKPGKLHAKCAVVDDAVLISSANLTDDAFNRNIELGVLIHSPTLAGQLRGYFEALMGAGVLQPLNRR